MLAGGVFPNLVASHRALEAELDPGNTVLVCGTLGFASRALRERVDVPLVTVHLAPCAYWSVHRAPRFPGLPVGDRSPLYWKRAMLGLARWIVDRQSATAHDAIRREPGLPPVRHLFDAWIHSPDVGVALFPDWFGPPQPDWPANVRCTGFPLFDDAASHPTDPALEAWLAAGDAPIVFTAGSANVQVAAFVRASIAAAGRIGRRALIVSRADEAMPSPMPAHARHASYVPFSRVLPRAAALVSHAGIGTCAQACAAGTPHLAMPISFDQFDNASRLVDLGVGAVHPAAKYSARRAARALSSLLSHPSISTRARDISLLVRSDDGPSRAATLIESAVTSHTDAQA